MKERENSTSANETCKVTHESNIAKLREAEQIGYIDTGKSDEDGNTIVLVPVYWTEWHYNDRCNPILESFATYDEVMKDSEIEGDMGIVDHSSMIAKNARIAFNIGVIDDDGNVEITEEKVCIDDMDDELIPEYIDALIDYDNSLNWVSFDPFEIESAAARKDLKLKFENLADDVISIRGYKVDIISKYDDYDWEFNINIYKDEELVDDSIRVKVSVYGKDSDYFYAEFEEIEKNRIYGEDFYGNVVEYIDEKIYELIEN